MAAWNGEGRPPSAAAAYDWMVDHGVDQATARAVVDANTLEELGDASREIVDAFEAKENPFGKGYETDRTGTPQAAVSSVGHYVADKTGVRMIHDAITGEGDDSPGGSASASVQTATDAVTAARDLANSLRAQLQGLSPEQVQEVLSSPDGGDNLLEMIENGPGGLRTDGAPLLPPAIANVSQDFRTGNAYGQYGDAAGAFGSVAAESYPGRVGARYFEKDLLEPYKWSREDRAEVQRIMVKIGLYKALGPGIRPRLGSWTDLDVEVFSGLLENANIDGRTWRDQLQVWAKHRPEDLERLLRQQRKAKDKQKPNKPTYRVSNPETIIQSAQSAAQNLIGSNLAAPVAAGLVDDVQQSQVASQQAIRQDQRAGGGGVVAEPLAPEQYAAQEIRERMPEEVDGFSFLNNVNVLLGMLGGPGG